MGACTPATTTSWRYGAARNQAGAAHAASPSWAAAGSPARTAAAAPSCMTRFTPQRSGVRAATSRSVAWKGLPFSAAMRTPGSEMNAGSCVQAMVSRPAQPIATPFTPPEKPA